MSVADVAAVTGRPVDAAEDTTIGFRGECTYTGGGAILVAVAAQFYGSEIDFGYNDYAEDDAGTPLEGVGDRAVIQDADAEFELVIQSGEYVVLVGVRGERRDQPDAEGYRQIGTRVLELLAPALS